jgi:hypothetical protein
MTKSSAAAALGAAKIARGAITVKSNSTLKTARRARGRIMLARTIVSSPFYFEEIGKARI